MKLGSLRLASTRTSCRTERNRERTTVRHALMRNRGSNLCASAASRQEGETKDKVTVFVAGATGRVGSRTVRELLKLGFWVRAGVRSAQRAEVLVQSVQEMMHDDKAESSGMQLIEKLEIVECDLEKQENIRPAIGNASIVVCCIGANEKEVFDVTGPFRIDYRATKSLIEAATVANVDHFILVTSLGTNKIGFPAFLLNLFWGVLIWKKKAEETLVASGIPYTIVRPGGMERPTDSFKETHNLVLAKEDTYFRGLVSNLQVAELVAFIAKDRRLSYCKVIEEITGESESGTLQHASSGFEVEIINIKVSKMGSLSPYSMYDDLKPPTSPTPTPSQTTASLKEIVTEQD
ncbi:Protein TIC 62, chloroplastic [Apostasia shenzhenica]|uniref:Protein TIC 62, chloroplastic n=1 Tax=Apostasia shenzhenica TaxID=1088818 RepID=A0A2I0A4F9_9ASPA|nr:Protein TIC 62, chloroplastic [Apostasia shenzhenica]